MSDTSLAVINLYEDSQFSQAFSKDGDYTYPIWQYPPWLFDIDLGQTREKRVFLQNDGPTVLRTLEGVADFQVVPFDTAVEGKETLLKLALTESGLDSAIAGQRLLLPTLQPNESVSFWLRTSVALGAAAANITSLVLRISGMSFPVIP